MHHFVCVSKFFSLPVHTIEEFSHLKKNLFIICISWAWIAHRHSLWLCTIFVLSSQIVVLHKFMVVGDTFCINSPPFLFLLEEKSIVTVDSFLSSNYHLKFFPSVLLRFILFSSSSSWQTSSLTYASHFSMSSLIFFQFANIKLNLYGN